MCQNFQEGYDLTEEEQTGEGKQFKPYDDDYFFEMERDRRLEEQQETDRKYKVVYDNGKPFETTYKTEEELKQGLKDFYLLSKKEDYAYFDVNVYDFFEGEEREISESQFIEEMISEILEETGDNKK